MLGQLFTKGFSSRWLAVIPGLRQLAEPSRGQPVNNIVLLGACSERDCDVNQTTGYISAAVNEKEEETMAEN